MSGFLTYSCAKSFVSFLAEGLNIELKGVVDVISYQAGEVATKFLRGQGDNMRTITPEVAAETSFRDIGFQSMTRGAFKHHCLSGAMNANSVIMQKMVNKIAP